MDKPIFNRNDSHLAYLEPPHLHDPSSVSNVASLPQAVLDLLPMDAQLALHNLEQSTSIVFASLIRLQELLEERFDRLLPSTDVEGDTTFSESSFFTYANALSAERTYLLSDAHPDWRHKASLARVAIQPYRTVVIDAVPANPQMPRNVTEWWDDLQSAMESWCEYARVVHMPDYEDTIGEYQAILRQTPALTADLDVTPLETPNATPTPTLEKEPPILHIGEIKDKDFPVELLSEEVTTKAAGLGLSTTMEIGGLVEMAEREFPLAGKVRDERKDSGVGMAD